MKENDVVQILGQGKEFSYGVIRNVGKSESKVFVPNTAKTWIVDNMNLLVLESPVETLIELTNTIRHYDQLIAQTTLVWKEEKQRRKTAEKQLEELKKAAEPEVTHRLEGPIVLGDVFVWEPLKPHATCVVKVTKIQTQENGERYLLLADYQGEASPSWNTEDRVREACVRVPMHTTPA